MSLWGSKPKKTSSKGTDWELFSSWHFSYQWPPEATCLVEHGFLIPISNHHDGIQESVEAVPFTKNWPKQSTNIKIQQISTKSNKSTPPQINTDNTVIQSRYVSLCAGTKKIGLKSKGWNWGHNWAGPSCAILPGENRQKDQKGEDWWSVETRWDVFAVFASHFWCWDFFFLCKLALFRWNLELLLFL